MREKEHTFFSVQKVDIKKEWGSPVAFGVLMRIASFKMENYIPTPRSTKLLLTFFNIPFIEIDGGIELVEDANDNNN